MYNGFWGFCALAAILWGHGVFLWSRARKQAHDTDVKTGKKILLVLIAVLSAAALVAGIVMMLLAAEGAAVHVMGLAVLCLAFWANHVLRRLCE